MNELFSAYYGGIPIGIIIGFTSYFLGYAIGGFIDVTRVGSE